MASERLPHPAESSTTGVDGPADETERAQPPMDVRLDGLDTAHRLQDIEARMDDITRALEHRDSPAASHGSAPRDSDKPPGESDEPDRDLRGAGWVLHSGCLQTSGRGYPQ